METKIATTETIVRVAPEIIVSNKTLYDIIKKSYKPMTIIEVNGFRAQVIEYHGKKYQIIERKHDKGLSLENYVQAVRVKDINNAVQVGKIIVADTSEEFLRGFELILERMK